MNEKVLKRFSLGLVGEEIASEAELNEEWSVPGQKSVLIQFREIREIPENLN